jgi:hypothetical protein
VAVVVEVGRLEIMVELVDQVEVAHIHLVLVVQGLQDKVMLAEEEILLDIQVVVEVQVLLAALVLLQEVALAVQDQHHH